MEDPQERLKRDTLPRTLMYRIPKAILQQLRLQVEEVKKGKMQAVSPELAKLVGCLISSPL